MTAEEIFKKHAKKNFEWEYIEEAGCVNIQDGIKCMEEYAYNLQSQLDHLRKENEELKHTMNEAINFSKKFQKTKLEMEANAMFWERRYDELKQAANNMRNAAYCEAEFMDKSIDYDLIINEHSELQQPNDYRSMQHELAVIKKENERLKSNLAILRRWLRRLKAC